MLNLQGCDSNPNFCSCKGAGWVLSNHDVWLQCQIHGLNEPHPEMDYPEEAYEEAYEEASTTEEEKGMVTIYIGTTFEEMAKGVKALNDQGLYFDVHWTGVAWTAVLH